MILFNRRAVDKSIASLHSAGVFLASFCKRASNGIKKKAPPKGMMLLSE
jgi:hypothetical protein